MSAFASDSFDAEAYSSKRPAYPRALYDYIDGCTRSPSSASPRTCVDLGCGPGLSTFPFLEYFDKVIGIEPGQGMVKLARDLLSRRPEADQARMRFQVGTAEDLSGIVKEDHSVDLVVACTSAHWFKDPLAVYREISRILKPSGSFFFFTYSTLHFPNHPEFERLLPDFNDGILGPYWSEPGHKLSETLLAQYPLPFPSNFSKSENEAQAITGRFDSTSFERSFFLCDSTTPLPSLRLQDEEKQVKINRFDNDSSRMIRRQWNLGQVEDLLNTWSGSHSWNRDHPGRDCAKEFGDKLREAGWEDGREYEVVWEVGCLFGKTRK
ncbi:hypothetical protein JCM16303_001264 [Sporobolomyces ruberrimus]